MVSNQSTQSNTKMHCAQVRHGHNRKYYRPVGYPESRTVFDRPLFNGSILGASPALQAYIKAHARSSTPSYFQYPTHLCPTYPILSIVVSLFTCTLFYPSFHPPQHHHAIKSVRLSLQPGSHLVA
jgi:hypothetical protein